YWREMYVPQVTSGPSAVTWSPDGRDVIYSMQGALWRQQIGSGVAVQVTGDAGYDYQPDWSPDGRFVVFARYANDAIELQLLDLATGAVRPVTANGAVNVAPRWSRDGRRIAYVSNEGGNTSLWVMDVPGGRRQGILAIRRRYHGPVGRVRLEVVDHAGRPLPARISVTRPDGRAYAPDDAWRHADEAFDRREIGYEHGYFHTSGSAELTVPAGAVHVAVWP